MEDDMYLNSQPQYCQRSRTYQIISTIAYLVGVSRQIFTNEREPPKPEVYE